MSSSRTADPDQASATAPTPRTDPQGSCRPEHPDTARIVVAGGTGLIGRHLCPALRAAGYPVTVLTRGAPRRAPDGTEFVHWQPGAPGAWTDYLAGARAVINLCGESIAGPRWTRARKQHLIHSRILPTETLVSAVLAVEDQPKVFIQASGVGYGGTGEAPLAESAPPGNDFLAQLAVAWEAPTARLPIRTVIARFGVVLAKDGGALPQMALPFRLFAGGPVAGGRQWLSWIHVDDAVGAIAFAITHALSGPVHVTSPEPVRNAEFARLAGRILHRPSWLPIPRSLMTAALGEQATLVCDGQRAIPEQLLEQGYPYRYQSLEHALSELLAT